MAKSNKAFTYRDIAWLTRAFIFTCFVFRAAIYNLVDKSANSMNLRILPASIWFVLFTFQFKALRKTSVFISWTILALGLFVMRLWLAKDSSLTYGVNTGETYHNAQGLIAPLLVLIFYQICRQISLKYYHVELSIPAKITNINFEENRKANWLEKFHSIGFVAIPVLTFYW